MALVRLSLGSNMCREENFSRCLRVLYQTFGDYIASPIYESQAVGFNGRNFFNSVVEINTQLTVGKLSECLRAIENNQGRDRNAPKFSARTLDIDILTYDDLTGLVDGISLPRAETLVNAFVLLPLSDIAPQERHPISQKTYANHWSDYDKQSQKLWPANFQCRVQTKGVG